MSSFKKNPLQFFVNENAYIIAVRIFIIIIIISDVCLHEIKQWKS